MMTIHEVSKKAIESHGRAYNLLKAAEESSELCAAILHELSHGEKNPDLVVDKIADMRIMMDVLSQLYDEEELESRTAFKIARLEGWLL